MSEVDIDAPQTGPGKDVFARRKLAVSDESISMALSIEVWLPFLDDYRTFVSLEPRRVVELAEVLAA